ncbi:MAG TPA: hypothetical protein VHM70_24250 [Polyangiaceae bacterium]|nr:hypothetical protein [Polyangiaceae bacterium]
MAEGIRIPAAVSFDPVRQTALIELRYWGAFFHGVEPHPTLRTVGGELRARLEECAGQPARGLAFASRTDSGVDAEQNFATAWFRPDPSLETRMATLCEPVACALQIKRIVWVPRALQARQCASCKAYRYRIARPNADVEQAWRVTPSLDLERMRRAASLLVGTHDFAAFRALHCSAKTSVRTLYRFEVTRDAAGICIDIEGDGFLRKMVRILVGTLAEVGAGLRSPEDVPGIVASRDRRRAGITAPAHGLTLRRVELSWPGQRQAGLPLQRIVGASNASR